MKLVYKAVAISIVVWVAAIIAGNLRRKAGLRDGNEKIDEMEVESFPASDSQSSWAGADK